ncbi:unnamed protein product [Discosporangium mesarthrocarpum]
MLEAWRPGRLSSGHRTSTPSPQTMQLVMVHPPAANKAKTEAEVETETEENGWGGGGPGPGPNPGRLPLLQLHLEEGQGQGEGQGWRLAVASPMSLVQGFALAVVGLEAALTGASVQVVDPMAERPEEDLAAGFVGFAEKVKSGTVQGSGASGSVGSSRSEGKKGRNEALVDMGMNMDPKHVKGGPEPNSLGFIQGLQGLHAKEEAVLWERGREGRP